MFRRSLLASPAALLCLAAPRARADAPVRVVTSFSILAEFAALIGGDAIQVSTLVGPDRSVTRFHPGKEAQAMLGGAAMLIENGLGLEPWLPALHRAARLHGESLVASRLVQPLMVAQLQPGGAVPGGAIKEQPNPHALQDPRNGVLYVHAIAEALAAMLPGAAPGIRDRAETLAGRIAQLDSALAQLFSEIPAGRRRVAMIRPSMAYFGARYGVAVRAIPGLPMGAAPSPRQLNALAKAAREDGASAVLSDNVDDPGPAETVARTAGLPLAGPLFTDALSPRGGPAATYLDLLRSNAQTLAGAMRTPSPSGPG